MAGTQRPSGYVYRFQKNYRISVAVRGRGLSSVSSIPARYRIKEGPTETVVAQMAKKPKKGERSSRTGVNYRSTSEKWLEVGGAVLLTTIVWIVTGDDSALMLLAALLWFFTKRSA